MTIRALSVVIPHYGDPALAQSLVAQLGAQRDAPGFEIIIVDDASPLPYPDDHRVTTIRRERNGGFGAAVNTGAAAARHPFLLVLNSDLSIGDTFVADLCHAAEPFQPAVVGPSLVGGDGTFQWPGRKFPHTAHYFVEWLTILARFKDTRWRHAAIGHDLPCAPGAVVAVDWVVGAVLLMPTDEFRAVGGFDESFHMNCEEVDLQRRLRDRGVPSVFLGTVTAVHAGGVSSGDSDRRRTMLMASRFRYAAKWRQHPSVLRLALTSASALNLMTNTARRIAGRSMVHPIDNFRGERGTLGRSRGTSAEPLAQRKLRVAFLTPWAIDDARSWSGVIRPMFQSISEVADVVPVSTSDVPTALPDRAIAKLLGKIGGRKYLWEFGIANAWKRSRVASRRVRAANVDVVLAVAASVDVAFARFRVPIVQVADATLERVIDFYPMFTGVSRASLLQARRVARRATRKTDRFLATSHWAMDSLVNEYRVDPNACIVAPLGPAIEPTVEPRHESHDGPLRVLVVAADWERKRGAACVEAAAATRETGIDVELSIVGDVPGALPSWVTSLGRLSHAELSEVYLNSDVLLDLSIATAASVVATDAAAHGLPVVALDTGGTSSIILDGVTGHLIRRDADERRAVARSLRQIAEGGGLATSLQVVEQARQTLSWDSWLRAAAGQLTSAAGQSVTPWGDGSELQGPRCCVSVMTAVALGMFRRC